MSTSPHGPPPGLTVGSYRLLARLGEGGMGVVHLAQQPGAPRVALKVLRPHVVGDREARERLAREVGSLTRVRSARVAEIVDADPWGPVPFVATRYVPGLSLYDHVQQRGLLAGADLVHLATGLAEALAAVHACGVVHRDVKPSNVLLEGRAPVLIDFGLARVADDPRLTHTGWFLGTPGYLAPEILHGDEASPASDVHSWAATVAYAGLGRAPFGRGPAMAIMDRVRRGEHDLTGLPGPVRALLADALDPEPRRRPTLAEVLDELRGDAEPTVPIPVEQAAGTRQATQPFAAAAAADAEARTDVLGRAEEPGAPTSQSTRPDPIPAAPPAPVARRTGPPPGPPPPEARGRVQPGFFPWDEEETAQEDEEPPAWVDPPPEPLARSAGHRLRRRVLLLVLVAFGGALVTAWPFLGSGLLAVLAWLLRSASLAGSARGHRRLVRGRRWYDGPQLLVAAPWHLVQSVPGTLLLVLWSAGLGLAGALLAYAVGLDPTWILATAGVLYAGSLGLGPGGPRVSGPLRHVADPVAAAPLAWLVAVLLLLAGTGVVWGIAAEGPDWTPAQGGPLPDDLVDRVRDGLP